MIPRPARLLLAFLCASLPAEVRDLKVFYQERCAICHGHDGMGRGPDGGRLGGGSLAEARRGGKPSEEELIAAMLGGKGAMPGFRRQLSESEARRLVASMLRPSTPQRKP